MKHASQMNRNGPNRSGSARPENAAASRSEVGAVLGRGLQADSLGQIVRSLKKQWKRYRRCLRRCQARFSEPAVHDSRIETRRLMALLELLSPFLGQKRVGQGRKALKRHLDTFDELRDTHVQLQQIARLTRRFAVASEFEKYLRKREQRLAKQTAKRIKRVKMKRLGKRITAWRKELGRSSLKDNGNSPGATLLAGVQAAFERTRSLKARVDPADTSTIHCTRVAFKRFRYMVELVDDLLPRSHKKLLARMHRYQTLMGVIQDAEVLLQAYDKYLLKKQPGKQGGNKLRTELEKIREKLVRAYLDRADLLEEFCPGPPLRKEEHPNAGSAAHNFGALEAKG